jgi:hypothetical protein
LNLECNKLPLWNRTYEFVTICIQRNDLGTPVKMLNVICLSCIFVYEGSFQYSLLFLISECCVLPRQLEYQAIIYRTATTAIVEHLQHKLWVIFMGLQRCHFFFPVHCTESVEKNSLHFILNKSLSIFNTRMWSIVKALHTFRLELVLRAAVVTDSRRCKCELGNIGVTLPT